MPPNDAQRVGYVMKMYPRLAETFILNEILAHEAAGLAMEIFSLRSPVDGRFHGDLGHVKALVTYVPGQSVKAEEFWSAVLRAQQELPNAENILEYAHTEKATTVYQAIMLAEAACERGVTHLHAHFATAATSVARLAARMAGITYSFTAHAKDIYHDSVEEQDMRRKLRDAASVVTVSDYNLEYLRTTYGADASRVRRIYNGLDLEQFSYSPPEDRSPLILGVGRLVEKKGFADLIAACAVLAKRGRRFRCEIIGQGVLREQLDAAIVEHGVSNHVVMLGARSRDEVLAHMKRAAVVAAPCVISDNGNRDGLPTVLLEAMALGTPCVSTDVTGIPELVRHDDTGLLAAQHGVDSLADQIERLLDDPGLGVRLAANARKLIEAEFDIHRNTPALRECFHPVREQEAPVSLEVG